MSNPYCVLAMPGTETVLAHGQVEHSNLWYYRHTDDGLEYLCAEGYTVLPHQDRIAWPVLPDDIN